MRFMIDFIFILHYSKLLENACVSNAAAGNCNGPCKCLEQRCCQSGVPPAHA